ncbi:unnamed protein product, partial [Symbiodinium sp. KB8]
MGDGKYAEFNHWLNTRGQDIDVALVTETHWKLEADPCTWSLPQWHCIHFASTQRKTAGMLLYVSKRVVSDANIRFSSHLSGRLAHVRLYAHTPVDLVLCYQHASNTSAEAETLRKRAHFWQKLASLLSSIPRRHLLMVLGDFNTPLAGTSSVIHGPCVPEAKHSAPADVPDFAALLEAHQLIALNTHRRDSVGTYKPYLGDDSFTQIDFIFTRGCTADAVAKQAWTLKTFPLQAHLKGFYHLPIRASVPSVVRVYAKPKSAEKDRGPSRQDIMTACSQDADLQADLAGPLERMWQEGVERGNFTMLYQHIRTLAPKQVRTKLQIRDQNGLILGPKEEIREVESFFTQLYATGQRLQLQLPQPAAANLGSDLLIAALKSLRPKKASLPTAAPAALWKMAAAPLAEYVVQRLHTQHTADWPDLWHIAWLCLLPKKPASHRPDQLRPISLLHPLAKSIAWDLNKLVLDAAMASLLEDPQFAYLPTRGVDSVMDTAFSHTAEVRSLMAAQKPSVFAKRAGKVPWLTLYASLLASGLVSMNARLQTTLWLVYAKALLRAISCACGPEWVASCATAFSDDLLFRNIFVDLAGLRLALDRMVRIFQVLQDMGMTPNFAKSAFMIASHGWQAQQHLARPTFSPLVLKISAPIYFSGANRYLQIFVSRNLRLIVGNRSASEVDGPTESQQAAAPMPKLLLMMPVHCLLSQQPLGQWMFFNEPDILQAASVGWEAVAQLHRLSALGFMAKSGCLAHCVVRSLTSRLDMLKGALSCLGLSFLCTFTSRAAMAEPQEDTVTQQVGFFQHLLPSANPTLLSQMGVKVAEPQEGAPNKHRRLDKGGKGQGGNGRQTRGQKRQGNPAPQQGGRGPQLDIRYILPLVLRMLLRQEDELQMIRLDKAFCLFVVPVFTQ